MSSLELPRLDFCIHLPGRVQQTSKLIVFLLCQLLLCRSKTLFTCCAVAYILSRDNDPVICILDPRFEPNCLRAVIDQAMIDLLMAKN